MSTETAKLKKSGRLVVIIVIAILGIKLIFTSHAQSPTLTVESESGAISGQSSILQDSTASGGRYIEFGTTLASSPTGPVAPSSGWSVDFADDFNAQLGTSSGQDNYWYPSEWWNASLSNPAVGNPKETQMYESSQANVANSALYLEAQYQSNVGPVSSTGVARNYISGIVSSAYNAHNGYNGFTWTPGDGSTFAFEIDAQWPVDSGELFNAFWTTPQTTWVNERDFFEGHHNSDPVGNIDTDWIYQTTNTIPGTVTKKQDFYKYMLGFDPSAAMHKYTYVIFPDQSWSFYIDGVLQAKAGNNGIAPVRTGANVPMQLVINYALDATTFTSGTRDFIINSVAVYQDKAHFGHSTQGGGTAPGTVVK